MGREATVSWGGPELIFRNDWPAAILVKVSRGRHLDHGALLLLEARAAGRDGRRASRTTTARPERSGSSIPRFRRGPRASSSQGAFPGFSVDYTRKVYRGDKLRRDEKFHVRYDPEDTIIEVGPTKSSGGGKGGGQAGAGQAGRDRAARAERWNQPAQESVGVVRAPDAAVELGSVSADDYTPIGYDGGMSEEIVYHVPGVHCDHCRAAIEDEVGSSQRWSAWRSISKRKVVIVSGQRTRRRRTAGGDRRSRLRRSSRERFRSAPGRVELEIEGMTCASCAVRVEKKLNRLEGVEATVNYATETASVRYDPARVRLDELIETIEAIGYGAALPRDGSRGDDPARALASSVRRGASSPCRSARSR